jgi:hypothetical protein
MRLIISGAMTVLVGFVGHDALFAQSAGGRSDFAPLLEIAESLPAPVKPHKDEKTGFLVGGTNPTEIIATLTEINGIAIDRLEADMRPMAKSDVGSRVGFLGPKEKLLEVLAADNRYIVDELGLSHRELARHLHAIAAIGMWQRKHKKEEAEFLYHGKRYKVVVETSRGTQPSPFRDGTTSGSNATITNLDNGKKLQYGLLVPYMMERYGFYEGKGTPYRLEPSAALEVLDFLPAKKKA